MFFFSNNWLHKFKKSKVQAKKKNNFAVKHIKNSHTFTHLSLSYKYKLIIRKKLHFDIHNLCSVYVNILYVSRFVGVTVTYIFEMQCPYKLFFLSFENLLQFIFCAKRKSNYQSKIVIKIWTVSQVSKKKIMIWIYIFFWF